MKLLNSNSNTKYTSATPTAIKQAKYLPYSNCLLVYPLAIKFLEVPSVKSLHVNNVINIIITISNLNELTNLFLVLFF